MKILLTTDWYTPVINGVVTSVLNLKRGLEERGHEVRVLTLSNSARSYVKGDVSYIGSVGAGIIYPGARIRTALRSRLVKDLIDWEPDIVHSNCEFSTFHPARYISAVLDIPLVHTYHTVYEDYTHYFSPSRKAGRQMVRIFSRRIASKVDNIIVPTDKIAHLLYGYGIFTPISVIPTGIECSMFSEHLDFKEEAEELRSHYGISEENLLLLFVGRLSKEKNVSELIDLMKKIENEPVKLMIVGSGPYEGTIRSMVKEKGLEASVIFTGMVDPERIGKYYHAGDFFVSASTSETQGLTYIEAAASGLPMLCRKDECLEGVIENGYNGWQYETPLELHNRVLWAMSEKERLAEMGKNSIQLSEKFTVEKFAESVERLYEKQIKSNSRFRPSRAALLHQYALTAKKEIFG